jgi:hypothetical protein
MTIAVECPECGAQHRVSDRLAVRSFPCRKCGEPIAAPTAEELDDESHASGRPTGPTGGEWIWFVGWAGVVLSLLGAAASPGQGGIALLVSVGLIGLGHVLDRLDYIIGAPYEPPKEKL